MLRTLLLALACLTAASMPMSAHAQTQQPAAAEGWHFYIDPPRPKPKPKQATPPANPATPDDPVPMSSAWLRANLDKYRDRAIDNPTRENLELYGLLQRLAMDKAERFSAGLAAVTAATPEIDESARTPTSGFARAALQSTMTAARASVLQKIARSAGIFYFFQSSCPFCHKENPVLQLLSKRHGISILPISLDGAPLVDGSFPNYVRDEGQGAANGVQVTPTLLLVRPPNKVMNLSVGLKTMQELEDRLLDVGLQMGLITQVEHDEATRGMPQQFMADTLDGATPQDLNNNPQALLDALRQATVRGGSSPWIPNPAAAAAVAAQPQ